MLVVCHGNICRSPLASAVMTLGLGQEWVRSRGLRAKPGSIVAKKVRDFVALRNPELIDYISKHRATLATVEDLKWAEVVFFMDSGNLIKLKELGPEPPGRFQCLGNWVGKTRLPDPNFMPRGPELDQVLQDVVDASDAVVGEYLAGASL